MLWGAVVGGLLRDARDEADELEFVESKSASQKAETGQGGNTGQQSGDGFEPLAGDDELPFT